MPHFRKVRRQTKPTRASLRRTISNVTRVRSSLAPSTAAGGFDPNARTRRKLDGAFAWKRTSFAVAGDGGFAGCTGRAACQSPRLRFATIGEQRYLRVAE